MKDVFLFYQSLFSHRIIKSIAWIHLNIEQNIVLHDDL